MVPVGQSVRHRTSHQSEHRKSGLGIPDSFTLIRATLPLDSPVLAVASGSTSGWLFRFSGAFSADQAYANFTLFCASVFAGK